jgi:hypothetical protein
VGYFLFYSQGNYLLNFLDFSKTLYYDVQPFLYYVMVYIQIASYEYMLTFSTDLPGRPRMSHHWIFFQRKGVDRKLQCRMYPNPSTAPATWVWQPPHRFLVRTQQEGGETWESRETPQRLGITELPVVLGREDHRAPTSRGG